MKQTNKKNTNKIFLTIIFLSTVIPTIYVYIEHAQVEIKAFEKAISETKKTKTLAEGIFFYVIGLGYVITTTFILFKPKCRSPYLIMIVGTIAIVIFYYISRISSIPIPGTEIIIVDRTSDWRDVITKIAQQILVVPVSILFARTINKN